MITLKQIRHALAVEEHCHFKRAAEACAVSQAALSTSISEMEKQLGYSVFERDNKKVLITPLGQQMLDKVRSIFIEVNDLHRLGQTANKPLSSELSIGMIPTIAPYLVPILLPTLHAQYPQLSLSIEEDQSEHLVQSVATGKLDTAILALPFDCGNLLTFPFWNEDFYLVAHRDDPMTKKKSIKSCDIALPELMLLKEGHCLKDHALALCGRASEAQVNICGTSLSTIMQLVSEKMGSTLIPEIAKSQTLQNHPALCAIKLDEPGPHRQLALIVRPNYPGLADLEYLKALISDRLDAHVKQA